MLNNFAGYLQRIRCHENPTITEMHLAHATTIPFENLDPIRGLPISLDLEVLEDKLVTRGRGGYCFEHNLLFGAALQHIGVTDVQPVLARVRVGSVDGQRPRTHILLKVTDGHQAWHVDVGFGADGLLSPIPYGPGEIHDQAGWHYRIIQDGAEFVLQLEQDGDFHDLYGFVDEPAQRIDIEVSNWYVCTNPRSPFTRMLYCSFQQPGKRWIISERSGSLVLTTKTPTSSIDRLLDYSELPSELKNALHLPGIERTAQGWELT